MVLEVEFGEVVEYGVEEVGDLVDLFDEHLLCELVDEDICLGD